MAALATRDGQPDARIQVRAAELVCADHAIRNAAANIQIHGGIGFTAECSAHHFVKRAHLLDLAGGARRSQRELLETSGSRA
jgi:alkylation response protein AidB-like acyl-CoA dehydrogenase